MSTAASSAASRLVTLPEGVPELTLGWEALRWAAKYLRHPNGIRAGERWQCTPDQARFWLWWYAVGPDGSWLYYHGVRRLAKGSGKSPFAAATSLVELCAPVRLMDFDPKSPGGCVGRPVNMPLVQIAAVAEAQTENTMRMVRAMAHKGSRLVADYRLDVGRTRYNMLPEGSLQVLTSSSATAEGAEATFIVADEAVSLSTVMPTPDGWKMPAEVAVGDYLYGSDGKPVKVTHLTPVFYDRPCSKLTFDDNTTLTVDDGHLWWAKPVSSAAKPKVWTTAEMVADGRRFCVPKMKALGGRHVRIGIDPYVLGAWLGDGSSRWASITSSDEDVDFMLAEVRRCGVPAASVVKSGNDRAPTISLRGNRSGDLYTKDGSSIRAALVGLDVLNNKHIPLKLKRSSFKQRLALLQGLMDTDGHIDGTSGAAVFVNASKTLANDVAELARTFGYSVSVTSRVDERWDSRPTIYKVSFRPDTDAPTFRMPRKADLVKAPSPRRWKSIRSIEPVPSEPVRCFEVDAPDHLFVAGDGWTVTHNTEHWLPAGNGPEFHATLLDNLTKSGNRMLETSNAWKPDVGSVAQDSYETWVAQEDGVTRNEKKVLYDARIAPADTDMADEGSLRRALEFVYADCPWANIDATITRIWSKNARPDDSKRKYLNRPTAPMDAWCDPVSWDVMAADGTNNPVRPLVDGERVVLFFDGSKTRDDTALVGCCMGDGHIFTVGVWSPGNSHDADEVVSVDAEAVDAAVHQTFDRFTVVGFFADVREWESFTKITWPQRWRDDLAVWAVPGGKQPEPIAWDMRSHDYDFTMACELVEAEIAEVKFTHDANPALRRHVANARRRDGRYGISVRKESPNSAAKIDAAVCMIGARMLYRLALDKQPTEPTGEAVFFSM